MKILFLLTCGFLITSMLGCVHYSKRQQVGVIPYLAPNDGFSLNFKADKTPTSWSLFYDISAVSAESLARLSTVNVAVVVKNRGPGIVGLTTYENLLGGTNEGARHGFVGIDIGPGQDAVVFKGMFSDLIKYSRGIGLRTKSVESSAAGMSVNVRWITDQHVDFNGGEILVTAENFDSL